MASAWSVWLLVTGGSERRCGHSFAMGRGKQLENP